ncbi:MAG: FAD-dependent oxidoreductase [Xanthobacteraceae bacterium]
MGQGNQIVANGKGTKGKILVLGGGYSGLWAAANAADVARECDSALAITLVSKDGYLEHRPRLYEKNPDTLRVAVGDLVESLGIDLVIGIAASIDARAKTVNVATADGPRLLGYDRLVLATGSELRQLPIPGMAEFAWNIDSYKGAKAFDDHLKAIAGALAEPSNNTFVIIGAGMTGIELAAEMRDRIEQHAGAAAAQAARIILVERGPDVGPTFGAEPRPLIKQALELAKIELRLGTGVASVRRDSVTLTTGEEIATATTVMTVGMSASTLTGQIPGKRDESGRLYVDDNLQVIGVEHVYATGDVACAYADESNMAIMSCQTSRTMGKYAGRNAACDLLGRPFRRYRQPDYTTCLDLGRFGAVFTNGFDRKVKTFGPEAKKRKRWINTELINPPNLGPADRVLAEMRIDERGR